MSSPTIEAAASTARRRLILRGLLGMAGLCILVVLAWHSRGELRDVALTMHPGLFLLAVVAGIALNLVQALFFARLMSKNGSGATTADVAIAFLVAQPGKYLPGKVWGPLIQRASLGNGSPLLGIATSNIELAMVVMVQMLGLGVACLAISSPLVASLAMAAGTCAGVVLLRFDLLAFAARIIPRLRARLAARDPARCPHPVGTPHALALSAGVMCTTLLASWLVLAAMGMGDGLAEQASMLGTLFIGFASSLLAFPVPVGLGVREAATAGVGAITLPDVPETKIIAVALFARGWQLAVDAVSLVLGIAAGAARRHR